MKAASCRGRRQTAHQTPIVLRGPPVRRPQLGRKTGDAIETSGDGQHLLFGPGIGHRFAEGADFLGVPEPEAGVIEGGLHFDCYSRLDHAFNRFRLKAEKLIDSKVLEQLIRVQEDASCSRTNLAATFP
jgi:hypothetical protein